MKKANSAFFGIVVTCFAVISSICFVVPGNKNGIFWLLYGITAIMFLFLLFAVSSASKHFAGKNSFLSFAPIKTGMICLSLQVVLLLLCLFVPTISIWICLVVSVFLLGIMIVSILSVRGGKAYIDRVDESIQSRTQFINTLKTEAAVLLNSEKDPTTKEQLASLIEKIRLSDPMSTDGLQDVESKINAKFSELGTANDKQGTIEEIKELLDERNTRCKALK